MFDDTLAPRAKNARPIGTISLSILLHAGAVVVIVALQLTSSIHGLEVNSPLTAYVAPPVSAPVPPPLRVAVPPPAPGVNVVPSTIEPDTTSKEPPSVALPAVPGAPVGLTVGAPGDPRSLFSDATAAQLGVPPPKPAPMPVGGNIRAPTRLVYIAPAYPSVAKMARVEGDVVLEATIDETGVVRDVKVLHSIPLLDRAAIDAVSGWRYSPTLLNGRAVAVIMLVTVKFSLK